MSRTTNVNKIIIDPLFPIPDGAEDQFEYNKDIDSSLIFDDNFYNGEDITEDVAVAVGNSLLPPTDIKIISQNLRRAPGGQLVVDVVVEFSDADGATDYEVQLIKV